MGCYIDIALEIRYLAVEERKFLRQEQGYKILAKDGIYEQLKSKEKQYSKKMI